MIGGGNPILFFQRSEPNTDHPGTCDYIFRLYARPAKDAAEQEHIDKMVKFFMTVSLEEDLPVQSSSQIMMEQGAAPSVLFGKREICLTRMHKAYDAAIGHNVEAALRSNAAKMGISPIH